MFCIDGDSYCMQQNKDEVCNCKSSGQYLSYSSGFRCTPQLHYNVFKKIKKNESMRLEEIDGENGFSFKVKPSIIVEDT